MTASVVGGGSTPEGGGDQARASVGEQLQACLARLAARVADAVAVRRGTGVVATPIQGFVVNDADVDRLLWGVQSDAPPEPYPGVIYRPSHTPTPLDWLVEGFRLDQVHADALIVVIAADLDPRFERLFAYLNDDAAVRRPTVGLIVELTGQSAWTSDLTSAFEPGGLLVGRGLCMVDAAAGRLSRPVHAPTRVVEHLLGRDGLDPALRTLVRADLDAVPIPGFERLAAALGAGIGEAWIHQQQGRSGDAMALQAFMEAGLEPLVIDLGRLPEGGRFADVARVAAREAVLTRRALLVVDVDPVRDHVPAEECAAAGVTVFVSRHAYDIDRWARPMLVAEVAETPAATRLAAWEAAVSREGVSLDADELATFASTYRMTPGRIRQTVGVAVASASGGVDGVGVADLQAAARRTSGHLLMQLARRVEPAATLADIVVPESTRAQLREVCDRVRLRDKVLVDWGLHLGAGARRGVSCVLAGPSGTGKTLSAEAVARELGVDLYTVDLSQVVDKYIGETEKNLEKIFTAAENVNAVLFFDEADALFGKRSAVKDSHDRHANVEVAYLLQRMEQFDGVAMLATNLLANLDEAFTRRFDVVVRYALPTLEERCALWVRHLPPTLPQAGDIDVAALAAALNVSGGVIANVCRAAAFSAAAANRPVSMADLVRASARELDKLGRLRNPSAFGAWAHLLDDG